MRTATRIYIPSGKDTGSKEQGHATKDSLDRRQKEAGYQCLQMYENLCKHRPDSDLTSYWRGPPDHQQAITFPTHYERNSHSQSWCEAIRWTDHDEIKDDLVNQGYIVQSKHRFASCMMKKTIRLMLIKLPLKTKKRASGVLLLTHHCGQGHLVWSLGLLCQ